MRSAFVRTALVELGAAAIAVVAAGAAGAGAAGCGGDDKVGDRDIPGLVEAVHPGERPLDVGRAAREIEELVRTARGATAAAGDRLGPHHLAVTTSIEVREADKPVETLKDTAAIDLAAEGDFHAVLDNSRDYGRDVYFVAGELYLRPRYGKFNIRAPLDDGEPIRIRGEIAGALAAYLELAAPGLVLSDGGARTVAGRAGRVVKLAAGEGHALAGELAAQRAWRKDARVERATGEVVLDAELGIPLMAELACEVDFQRDGHRFAMKLSVHHEVSAIGAVAAIPPPPTEAIAPIAAATQELDEREALLEGIAPPSARAPTPDNPTGAASATGAPAQAAP